MKAGERLPSLLRKHKETILDRWESELRTTTRARPLSKLELRDGIPKLLDELAEAIETPARLRKDLISGTPAEHAHNRVNLGYDLETLLREYAALRSTIYAVFLDEHEGELTIGELSLLGAAIDEAVVVSSSTFATARLRVIDALDRISQQAIGAERMEDFLPRLLRATVECFSEVHLAMIFLGSGEDRVLRARAKSGADIDEEKILPIADRFAYDVIRNGRAAELAVLDHGIKSLYGTPLFHGSTLIGVAVIGSASAEHLSPEDQIIVRMMSERASSALLQRERETAVAQLDATFNAAQIAVAFIDPALRVARKNATFERVPRDMVDLIVRGAQLALDTEVDSDPIELGNMRASCYLVTGPGGVPLGVGVMVTDISDKAYAEERAQFISEVSTRLAQTLSVQETFEAITQIAVPRLGDWCAIDLLAEDGSIREPAAIHHIDSAKVEVVRELRRRYPPDPNAPSGIVQVIKSGKPLLLPEIPEQAMTEAARDEQHLGLLRELDIKSGLVVPLFLNNQPIGALSLATSESGRTIGPRELEQANELSFRASFALANARLYERAQEAIRLRESVLAIVSHDLKNPLGVIMMSVGVLHQLTTRGEGSRKMTEVASRVQRAAERMHYLINDLVDFASIQAGRLSIVPKELDPAEIVRDVAESFSLPAQDAGVTIETYLAPDLRPIKADRERIFQVFSNIIGNAIKVTPSGGTIEIRAVPDTDYMIFSVRDTGPGIPREDLPHVFERYFRSEGTMYKGTGLGLAIAKGLVEAHGGRLIAQNDPRGGAIFSFSIPTSDARADRDRG